MKITFQVNYRTEWGENLFISGSPSVMGGGDADTAVPMNYSGDGVWSVSVELPDPVDLIKYSYLLRRNDGSVRREWGKPHTLALTSATPDIVVIDRWTVQPDDKPYYASAFTDCIFRRTDSDGVVNSCPGHLTLCVDAPMVHPDEAVAVTGEAEIMGGWNPEKALRMSDADYPTWRVNIPLQDIRHGGEYKFVIVKKSTGALVAWEKGDNRTLTLPYTKAQAAVTDTGQRLVNPLPLWRGAGVAIPVFSLRSDEGFGVGAFMDLKKMVDWAVKTGQNFVQVLPVNDTTMTHRWTDSYPYNANSTFALHPMYLRPSEMGRLADPERQQYFDNLARELNNLPALDYERVDAAKYEYTRELFAQNGDKDLSSEGFKEFFARNASWLTPYAAFCVLRDLNGTPDMRCWGEYAEYDEERVGKFIASHTDDINYVYYLQYHLDRQMRIVHDYARAQGVAIKGDIPIGISRTSADAWISPRLFNLDCQAGAPPDDFSVLGQNWGFPTYNWEEMAKDGFAWWKARFRKMSEYFDAYRIDHVLGFFRIWQIPVSAIHGLLGIFNRALPFSTEELRRDYDFWLDTSRHTRPLILDSMLDELLGDLADECRERYLIAEGNSRYRLRPEYDTQRKVADHFAALAMEDKADKERINRLCNGLLMLIDDVLFIEDPYEKGRFHPRISAWTTNQYKTLGEYERWCFDRLYHDFFYCRNNDFWQERAMWKLPPLIDATDMLVCAEDLGMIPACVPAVMDALKILVLEIQRMPKEAWVPFGNTAKYPYYSVCTTSSHDMDGIRRWWESNPELTQRYYNEVLHEEGDAPAVATPDICQRIITMHLDSPSMLCILPLQDWLSTDGVLRRQDPREELINIPANPRHYWRYRMHLTLEQLNEEKELNNRIREMIRISGR